MATHISADVGRTHVHGDLLSVIARLVQDHAISRDGIDAAFKDAVMDGRIRVDPWDIGYLKGAGLLTEDEEKELRGRL